MTYITDTTCPFGLYYFLCACWHFFPVGWDCLSRLHRPETSFSLHSLHYQHKQMLLFAVSLHVFLIELVGICWYHLFFFVMPSGEIQLWQTIKCGEPPNTKIPPEIVVFLTRPLCCLMKGLTSFPVSSKCFQNRQQTCRLNAALIRQ